MKQKFFGLKEPKGAIGSELRCRLRPTATASSSEVPPGQILSLIFPTGPTRGSRTVRSFITVDAVQNSTIRIRIRILILSPQDRRL